MPKRRTLSKRNKYYLPRETMLTCLYFARTYPYMKQGEPGMIYTGISAEERQKRIQRRIDTIERAADAAAFSGDLREWILKAVTTGATYEELKASGFPCDKLSLDVMKQRFYWELNKIWEI